MVITSYAVAEAICVPLTGWLAGRFGGARVFTLSLIGFTIFSVLCGFIHQFRIAGFPAASAKVYLVAPYHAAQSDVTHADFPSRKAIPSDGHVGNDDSGWPNSWSNFRGNH